jgi:ATP-dependent DNA helicase DinG
MFGESGSLAAALPGFEPRSEQAALAQAVESALAGDEHLLAEAGTGTGKSLAYLIPSILSGKRVVVATATKALQEQLLAKDVPVAAAALGRDIRCTVLKGRQNYLCRKSLHGLELLAGAGPALFRTADDAQEFERMRDWVASTESGDRAGLMFEPSASLWAELSVGGDRCLGRRCTFAGTCFSERAREAAGEAELIIVNHALYLADVAIRSRAEGSGILPEHDAVVFDEAHRLEEAAASWFGGRVSLARLRLLARDAERACREHRAAPPLRALADIDRLGALVLGELEPASGRVRLTAGALAPVLDAVLALVAALGELASGLKGVSDDADAIGRRSLAVAEDLDACLTLDDPDRVSWAEPSAVAWAPVDVSEILRDELWERPVTAVLVSATLEPSLVRKRLGLDDANELVVESPYDYRTQALLYAPVGLPEPRAPGAYDAIADEITALCRVSRGRALVLTTSYRALDALLERVAPQLSYPVFCQGDAPRERLLAQFRDQVDSVLFATATFWQGVDVSGESLSLVVIDKLPFSAPGDPLVEARCERVAREGGDWFADYALPSAVLQLRQGFGRLIRSHDDRGVVAVLDPRLRTRAYGRSFVAALPSCPVVSDLAAVSEFFAEELRATG